MRRKSQHLAFGFFHQLRAYGVGPVYHEHIVFPLVFKHFGFGLNVAFHSAVVVQMVGGDV